jgi:Integrase core domain
MIRDRDRIYATAVTRRLHAMGIRDKPIAPASPWQNGFAERLIGSIRRECLDHIIVLGEAHLCRILKSYARYYNETRTHLALEKDAPLSRTVKRAGRILCRPVLGGLHHECPDLISDRHRGYKCPHWKVCNPSAASLSNM